MSITIADLMTLPIYQKHIVPMADAGMNNEVRYLTVMEAPDFHMSNLGSHVLVLTTLSAHHESLQEINRVIEALCQAGAAGIIIKLGRFVNEVPQSTIEIARKHEVPLLTCGGNVMFREILAASLALVADSQRQIIERINALNIDVFQTLVHNASPQELIQLLCSNMPCCGCCLDAQGSIIGRASSINDSCSDSEIRRVAMQLSSSNTVGYVRDSGIIAFPCRTKDQLLGVFCLYAPDVCEEQAVPLAEIIVNAISIKLLENDLKVQAKREMMASILDDILFTEDPDENRIRERLRVLGFHPLNYHMLAVLKDREGDLLSRNPACIIDTIQTVFSLRFESVISVVRGGRFVILMSSSKKKTQETIEKNLEFCHSEVVSAAAYKMDIGVSAVVQDFCKIANCMKQANLAIRYGRISQPEKYIYLYDDYFEMNLVAQGLNTDAGKCFFDRIIDPIIRYDQKYNSELWASMECCFSHNKLENAAEALFIHISTLRYRLQKIEQLTGYNYFNNKHKMTLYMAYLLYKASNAQD